MLYVHFSNLKDAAAIKKSGVLWSSSYVEGVYAVAQGGFLSQSVALSKLGRAPDRKVAIVFKTKYLPDYAVPEEVVWHMDKLPIQVMKLTTIEGARKIIDESAGIDPEFDFLQIPLHLALNDFDKGWVRFPESLEPWVPGRDNEKYKTASKMFRGGASEKEIVRYWNSV